MCSSPGATPTCGGSPLTTKVQRTESSSGSPGWPWTLVMMAGTGGIIGPGFGMGFRDSPLDCGACAAAARIGRVMSSPAAAA